MSDLSKARDQATKVYQDAGTTKRKWLIVVATLVLIGLFKVFVR